MKKSFYIFIFLLGFVWILNAQNVTDAKGLKQGYWKKLDDKTNHLVYEGLFKDDKPQGIFKYYYYKPFNGKLF